MDKVLIIGQAPPAVKQDIPYDTTMLYDWLEELGISKEKAQEIFEFDAVYDTFTGFSSTGGHLKPSEKQMEAYWKRELKEKVNRSKGVLVLGRVAEKFIKSKDINKDVSYTMHPSRRNYALYIKNKHQVLEAINKALEIEH